MSRSPNHDITPSKEDEQVILALLIKYLTAIQQSPTLTDGQWKAAENTKQRLNTEAG